MPLVRDPELIREARYGGTALERLIAAVWPEAYRIAFRIVRDAGLAEDVAQDACVTLTRSLPTLENANAFSSWMYKIVVNAAVSTVRRRSRTQPLEAAADRGISCDRTDALDLRDALATLSIVQRGIIILYYYGGFKSGEIATALQLPSSTVRFHLMLARRTLRTALAGPDVRIVSPAPEEILSNVH